MINLRNTQVIRADTEQTEKSVIFHLFLKPMSEKTEVPKLNQIRTCWTQHGCRGCLSVVCFEFRFGNTAKNDPNFFFYYYCCGISFWSAVRCQIIAVFTACRPERAGANSQSYAIISGKGSPRNGHTFRMFSMFSPQHCLLFKISIFFLTPSKLKIYIWMKVKPDIDQTQIILKVSLYRRVAYEGSSFLVTYSGSTVQISSWGEEPCASSHCCPTGGDL